LTRLLAREPDPADQRATLLTVTPHGLEYLRQGMARRAEELVPRPRPGRPAT
jgi:DNA-binding MarR family transcriptional regulator